MERIEFIVKSHLFTALYQTKINNINKFFFIWNSILPTTDTTEIFTDFSEI